MNEENEDFTLAFLHVGVFSWFYAFKVMPVGFTAS